MLNNNTNDLFRQILHLLGDSLGEIIKEQNGLELFETIEGIRAQSKTLRDKYDADNFENLYDDLNQRVDTLDPIVANEVSRAFTVYLILNNIAELSYQAIMLQRELEKQKRELLDSLQGLKSKFKTKEEIESFLRNLQVKITLTQHPTEVRRRTILLKEKNIYQLLLQYYNSSSNSDDATIKHFEFLDLKRMLTEQIEALWLTSEVRISKPTLKDEIDSAGAFANYSLFEVFNELYADIWRYLNALYEQEINFYPILKMGSWVGSDRDGNPFVTVEVTKYALEHNKKIVLRHYIERLDELVEHVSISQRRLNEDWSDPTIKEFISFHYFHFSDERIDIYKDEPFRQFLFFVKLKLEQSLLHIDSKQTEEYYSKYNELLQDLKILQSSLERVSANKLALGKLITLIKEINIYKFHWAELDIRQHSNVFGNLINEIFTLIGKPGYTDLTKDQKVELLSKSLEEPRINFYLEDLTDLSKDLWQLFRLIRNYSLENGDDCFGSIIISMSTDESDILEVLLCQYWVGIFDPRIKRRFPRPIVPLFETIEDLERAPEIMVKLWNHPSYKLLLGQLDMNQEIMIGYSDSGKDGGYISSQWNIFLAQEKLIRLAKDYGIKHIFFHGRGGSVGRGGVDIHKAINGLPSGSTRYGFKITEQGEVISQKYLHKEIAYFKLTQMMSGIFSAQLDSFKISESDRRILHFLAQKSRSKYRKLIYDTEDFYSYFEQASPIQFIGFLNIGSRPSKRATYNTKIEDLRAIPWIFAWTQNRTLLPVWYGLGTAITSLLESDSKVDSPELPEKSILDTLIYWYNNWPFFTNLIESISVQLLKADMNSARKYSELASSPDIFTEQFEEYFLTRKIIRSISNEDHILDNSSFLKRAILARTPYMDPLTLIQINAIKNYRKNTGQEENLKTVILTITGIAAGMKNTG